MIYSNDFFQLQVRFAHKIAGLDSTISLGQAINDFTALASICGPKWSHQLDQAIVTTDVAGSLHQHYLDEPPPDRPNDVIFGCFAYSYPWQDRPILRLHFRNREADPLHQPLALNRVQHRQQELRALVAYAAAAHPEITTVRGGSWLYNLPSYRRIFPDLFLAQAKTTLVQPKFMSAWGQFALASGAIRKPPTERFLRALAHCTTIDECLEAFPLARIEIECDFGLFRSALTSLPAPSHAG